VHHRATWRVLSTAACLTRGTEISTPLHSSKGRVEKKEAEESQKVLHFARFARRRRQRVDAYRLPFCCSQRPAPLYLMMESICARIRMYVRIRVMYVRIRVHRKRGVVPVDSTPHPFWQENGTNEKGSFLISKETIVFPPQRTSFSFSKDVCFPDTYHEQRLGAEFPRRCAKKKRVANTSSPNDTQKNRVTS